MPDMTSLSVGDRLVYPNQGLCTVTEIKTEEIAGQKLTFVSMVIIETGAKVKVPKEKLEKNGVRRVSTAEDVKKVVDYLKGASDKASLDWKKRARENTARLSEGGLLGLAEVVKGLQELSELRPLPPKERDLYNDARHLFVDELSAAMGVPQADAEDAFDILLFIPGKDRPKRTAEEFAGLGGEDDELGLDGDLIGIDGGEEVAEETPESEVEKSEEGESEDEEGAPKKKTTKAAPPPPAAPPKGAKGKKTLISDVEVTMPASQALTENLPKKRGRPPKPRPAVTEPPPPPKKRGRPPKPKPAVTEPPPPPKKRGRPPKAK
jgi:RNA polymerase-interacting CarD/CdnL/TRCF family regulator